MRRPSRLGGAAPSRMPAPGHPAGACASLRPGTPRSHHPHLQVEEDPDVPPTMSATIRVENRIELQVVPLRSRQIDVQEETEMDDDLDERADTMIQRASLRDRPPRRRGEGEAVSRMAAPARADQVGAQLPAVFGASLIRPAPADRRRKRSPIQTMSRKCQNRPSRRMRILTSRVDAEDDDLHHHDDDPDAAGGDVQAVGRHQREEGRQEAAAAGPAALRRTWSWKSCISKPRKVRPSTRVTASQNSRLARLSLVFHRQRRHAEGEAAGEQHSGLDDGALDVEQVLRRPGRRRSLRSSSHRSRTAARRAPGRSSGRPRSRTPTLLGRRRASRGSVAPRLMPGMLRSRRALMPPMPPPALGWPARSRSRARPTGVARYGSQPALGAVRRTSPAGMIAWSSRARSCAR